MLKKYTDYYKKIKKFTRLGIKDPKDLVADDWRLVPSGGYSDAYALIRSASLDLTLSYGPNSYPLTNFMKNDIIDGRLELCKFPDKDILSIDGSSNLVFTEVGLITYDEYEFALSEIEDFKQNASLGYGDLEVGSVYVSIEEKYFIYLGAQSTSANPKIQEIVLKQLWNDKFSKNGIEFKKEKSFGKTVLIDKVNYEFFKDLTRWSQTSFNDFENYALSYIKKEK